jgi:hypothetical protein
MFSISAFHSDSSDSFNSKHWFFAVLLLLFSTSLFGQFGFSYRYQMPKADDWEQALIETYDLATEGSSFLEEGHLVAVHYWFRLPNARVEFLPEIQFGLMDKEYATNTDQTDLFSLRQLGLALNIQVYPFDFYGDCNCPTFSKTDPLFKKGFFIQAAPLFSFFQNTHKSEPQSYQTETTAFGYYIGAGLDIGLSDLITLTPHLGRSQYFDVEWQSLAPPFVGEPLGEDVESNLGAFQFGLRFTLRLDEY